MSTPLLVVSLIGLLIIAAAVRCWILAPHLSLIRRLVSAIPFVVLGLFSVYGFAAAMEPGDGHMYWRVLYASVFLACVLAIARLVLAKSLSSKIDEPE